MKTATPFWPLVKNELTFQSLDGQISAGGVIFTYWLGAMSFPLFIFFGRGTDEVNLSILFEAGFLPVMAFSYLLFMSVILAYATIPTFRSLLSINQADADSRRVSSALEFLFTRAVDRRKLFRARMMVFYLVVSMPLVFNVLVSAFAPKVRMTPFETLSGQSKQRLERYAKAFPASQIKSSSTVLVPDEITLTHGALIFSAWLASSATLVFLLLQAYGMLIARRVKSNQWWTAIFPAMPLALLFGGLVLFAKGWIRLHTNVLEDSFLLFAAHPWVVLSGLIVLAMVIQTWSERRFSKLEII